MRSSFGDLCFHQCFVFSVDFSVHIRFIYAVYYVVWMTLLHNRDSFNCAVCRLAVLKLRVLTARLGVRCFVINLSKAAFLFVVTFIWSSVLSNSNCRSPYRGQKTRACICRYWLPEIAGNLNRGGPLKCNGVEQTKWEFFLHFEIYQQPIDNFSNFSWGSGRICLQRSFRF